jgi:hypothetical protein
MNQNISNNDNIPVNNINFENIIGRLDNNISKYDQYLEDNYKTLHDIESETTNKLNIKSKSKPEKIDIDSILIKFSKNMNQIIDDIVTLFTKSPNYNNNMDIYIYYFKGIIKILTEKERLFNVGILFIIISIFFSFIEITS